MFRELIENLYEKGGLDLWGIWLQYREYGYKTCIQKAVVKYYTTTKKNIYNECGVYYTIVDEILKEIFREYKTEISELDIYFN